MQTQGGLIKLILIIIIIIAILSYFGISIRGFVEKDIVQQNFGFVWNWCKDMWKTYLAEPATYLWNNVFIDLIWEPFVESMGRIKNGGTPDIIEQAPQAPN